MKIITSSDNDIYKSFAKLYKRKYRDREGMYIIEGINLIKEALKNGAKLKSVFLRKDFDDAAAEELIAKLEEKVPVYMLSKELFDRTVDTETPQGIAAVSFRPVYTEESFFEGTDNVIVLDSLQDPGNIGTVIRSADAAGFSGAVVLKGTADLFSPKTVRAAAGSLYRVKLLYLNDPEDAVNILHKYGFKVAATSPYAKKLVYDTDISEKTAIVIGNEANGVRENLKELADENIKLPMAGNIESLNAAVAAAVVMYESVRQRIMKK